MKITADTSRYASVYSGRTNSAGDKTSKSSFSQMLGRAAADSIEISSVTRESSDEEFVKSLSSQISAEVRQGASEQELSALRQQIALGDYDINAADIARKILG